MSAPAWLEDPGDRDITAHVDFHERRGRRRRRGADDLGFLDQTYFLLGLLDLDVSDLKTRLALKTLLLPGRAGQHPQGADSGQRRRAAVAARLLLPRPRHVKEL